VTIAGDTQQPDDEGQHEPEEQPDDEGQHEPEEQPDDEGQHEPEEQPEEGRPAQREQRLRARAREAETERDALRGRLERYQRTEVEAVAAEVLANGSDLLAVRADLAQYLDDDGAVDPARVREAAEAVATERPHWRVDNRDDPGRRQVRGHPKPHPGDGGARRPGWGSVISRPGE